MPEGIRLQTCRSAETVQVKLETVSYRNTGRKFPWHCRLEGLMDPSDASEQQGLTLWPRKMSQGTGTQRMLLRARSMKN